MRQAHDKTIVPTKDADDVIVKVSLKDALLQGERVNACKPLNFLDIPGYGDFHCDVHLASDLYSYKQTLAHPRLHYPIPMDNIWHIVATKDVYTPLHMDAEGTAVTILVEVGAKLVFMLVPSSLDISEASKIYYSLDIDQDVAQSWTTPLANGQPVNIVGWQVQGVLLRPGDMLVMPPGMYHFVYTLEPSICHGRHFFCSSTIRQTCWALFHSFVLGRTITNTDHTKNRTSLVRLIAFWHKEFVEREWTPDAEQDDDSVHMPQWATMTGAIDFLTLSNVFELGAVLWLETYNGDKADTQHITEYELARKLSRDIFDRYTKLFELRVIDRTNNHHIRSPQVWHDVRQSFLVQQMSCLLRHSQLAQSRNFAEVPSPEHITNAMAIQFQSTGEVGKRAWDRFACVKEARELEPTLFPIPRNCDSYEWTYHGHTENPYIFQFSSRDGSVHNDTEWSTVQEQVDALEHLEQTQDEEYKTGDSSETSSDGSLSEGATESDLEEGSEYDIEDNGVGYHPSCSPDRGLENQSPESDSMQFEGEGSDADSVLSLETWMYRNTRSMDSATIVEKESPGQVNDPAPAIVDAPSVKTSPISSSPSSHGTSNTLNSAHLPITGTSNIGKRMHTGENTKDQNKRQKTQ
ncbi:hypothetical protein V5O48_007164 [Marasmius crinis-equi]|uniref:JmjC domain-containing protein n=1 Tax=Marasmius crinis-equi TaxID=585013 RepID=A0ABR3FHH1_9AGAR